MSDVLGYDIDGRPLRAGDAVVQVEAYDVWARQHSGKVFRIVGPYPAEPGWMETSVPCLVVNGPDVRKLDNHRPASQSFDKIMKNLKAGNPPVTVTELED